LGVLLCVLTRRSRPPPRRRFANRAARSQRTGPQPCGPPPNRPAAPNPPTQPRQAAANGRVVARETIRAARKDVLAKCYGGDVTRKKKLLEKQKEGKRRLRRLGSLQVPAEVFPELMKAL
jgi:hypothetical protein